jgi:BirA family biotin operon repressor/biotin-[acetyl-CoA-carboxylase] ligase
VHFERIDSTNAEARRLAQGGERGPLWIRADEQTGGRGRLGRGWVSEPGNLYATLLFACDVEPAVAAQLGFAAAVAVRDAVAALAPAVTPRIKWPNDLLIGGAKFSGLLAEVVAPAPLTLALGCGVNVAHAPAATRYPVTCLNAHAVAPLTVDSVFQELAARLSNVLAIWDDGRGFAALRERWLAHALGLGGACQTEQGEGVFRGLAADGALLLETADGRLLHIHSGEVRFAELEQLRRP